MSVWTTRSLDRSRDYIVVKHYLPGINGKIHGVTFRSSYGVVENNSKMFKDLMRMPVFKNAKVLPITILARLPFITRSRDIERVYGKDVYLRYLHAVTEDQKQAKLMEQAKIEEEDQKRREELQKKLELEKQLQEAQHQEDAEKLEEIVSEMPQVTQCAFETRNGTLCKFEAYESSPSGYCKTHVLQDPKLEELSIKVPMAMTKGEKRKFRKSLYKKLEKLKKQGAF